MLMIETGFNDMYVWRWIYFLVCGTFLYNVKSKQDYSGPVMLVTLWGCDAHYN